MYLLIIAIILLLLIVIAKLLSTIISLGFGSPSGETSETLVKEVFTGIKIHKASTVYDLGSGIGNVVLAISKFYNPKNIIGIEVSPLPYVISKIRTQRHKNITIKYQNLLNADLTDADIVFCYLLPGLIKKILPKLKKELRPGSILISPLFQVPGLTPVKIINTKTKKVYIYKFE